MQAKPGTTGQCGCGRSPTGKCCGWHALSESEFQSKLESFMADQMQADDELNGYRNMANDLWFSGGSCTGGKPE
jgi:hypothetical protein